MCAVTKLIPITATIAHVVLGGLRGVLSLSNETVVSENLQEMLQQSLWAVLPPLLSPLRS